MNSVFSRGQGVASLHQNLCSISKQLAMSNLTTIAPGYYANESMMDFLITPLSSAISDHSLITGTPEAIRGWLMSLPQDSRASRFQSQGNNSEKTILGTNGRKLGIASASYDRDLRSWKTSQASCLNPTSDEYSGTWPKSGMMLDGKLYLLKKQVIATKEIDCGLWPTPTLCGNHNRKGLSKTSGDGLATAVKQFPTPTTQDFKRRGPNSRQQGLSNIERLFPTPTVNDSKNTGSDSQKLRNSQALNVAVNGILNPDWVEWLMGWPIGISDIAPLDYISIKLWRSLYGINKQRVQESPKEIQSTSMYCVWFDNKIKQASQRPGPNEQQPCKCGNIMHKMPCKKTPRIRNSRICERIELCSMRQVVQAEEDAEINNMFKGVPFSVWKNERAKKVGREDDNKSMCMLWQRICFQEGKRKNVWAFLWEQASMGQKEFMKSDPHPDIPRTTDKTENRVNRLKAIGNGQVPTCAAKAWTILNT